MIYRQNDRLNSDSYLEPTYYSEDEYIEPLEPYRVSDGTEFSADYDESYVKDYADDMAEQEQEIIRVYIGDDCIYVAGPKR